MKPTSPPPLGSRRDLHHACRRARRFLLVIALGMAWSLFADGAVVKAAENLVPNPGFELPEASPQGKEAVPDNWIIDVKRGLPSITLDTTVFHSGKQSLKFDRIDRDLVYVRQSNVPVSLAEGSKVDFGFWMKTDNVSQATNHFSVFITFADASSAPLKFSDGQARVTLHGVDDAADWKRIERKGIPVPKGSAKMTIYLSTSWVFGTFWIDDVEVTPSAP